MNFEPVAALIAYHAALDDHDMDRVEKLMAVNATYESDGIGLVKGRDAIVTAMRNYFAASPDHQAWNDVVSTSGARSARCHWRLEATNKQTGEIVKRSGTEEMEFDQAGLICKVVVLDET